MRLRTIPSSEVAADLKKTCEMECEGTSNPWSRFNTAHHDRVEMLDVVPEAAATFIHEEPPWEPYDYTLWHSLIAESQHLQPSDTFVGRIPSFMWQDLMLCHSAWFTGGTIPTHLLDDVVETLLCTHAGKDMAVYFDGQRKWFVRLAQMSPKDSPLGGTEPSTTLHEVLAKICSSMRAWGCLQRIAEDAKAQGCDIDIKVVVNRWDEGMDPCREFRVFIPPPLARMQRSGWTESWDGYMKRDRRISAISQYRWTEVFLMLYPDLSIEQMAKRVHGEAGRVLDKIVDFTREGVKREIREMLMKYGFSFDVIVKEGGEVQLVEINPFGAMSGCGACLFHWVRDGRALYGLDEMEFAITVGEPVVCRPYGRDHSWNGYLERSGKASTEGQG